MLSFTRHSSIMVGSSERKRDLPCPGLANVLLVCIRTFALTKDPERHLQVPDKVFSATVVPLRTDGV